MATETPFLRKIEVRLKSNNTPSPLVFKADGTVDNLHINFTVSKQLVGAANEAIIEIYNLKPETIRSFYTSRYTGELWVGTQKPQDNLKMLTSGRVVKFEPVLELPDHKIVITLRSMYDEVCNAVIEKDQSYAPNTPVYDIVKDLVAQMAPLKFDANKSATLQNSDLRVGSKGYTIKGTVVEELNRLSRCYEFSWSIYDGVFQALMDTQANNTIFPVSLAAGNLFNVKPVLQDVVESQINTAVQVEAYMNPGILPGDQIDLKSKFVPQYDGIYKVHTIEFSGTSHGDEWKMSIESKVV